MTDLNYTLYLLSSRAPFHSSTIYFSISLEHGNTFMNLKKVAIFFILFTLYICVCFDDKMVIYIYFLSPWTSFKFMNNLFFRSILTPHFFEAMLIYLAYFFEIFKNYDSNFHSILGVLLTDYCCF